MKRYWVGFVPLLLGLAGLVEVNPPVAAQAPVTGYKKTVNSVGWVINKMKQGTATGSASLIDRKNKILCTNYHVVDDSKYVIVVFPEYDGTGKLIVETDNYWKKVRANGGYRAEVLFAEKRRDLAAIRIVDPKPLPKHIEQVEINIDDPTPGNKVYSIGSPGASEFLYGFTPGEVRQVGKRKWIVGGGSDFWEVEARTVEATSATNHGDSGGPMFNEKDQQIAVTQGGAHALKANAMSFFIHISEYKTMCDERKLKVNWKIAGQEFKEGEEEKGAIKSSDPVAVDPKAVKEKDDKKTAKTDAKTEEKKETAKAADPKAEEDAAKALRVAKVFVDNGKKDSARDRLNKLIKDYPDTKAAGEAKLLLKGL